MEEQLISYETAVLAKEKGLTFDDVRFYYVYDYKKLVHEKYNDYNIRHPDYKNRFIAVPSQSLLQRWIREKYNIHIIIQYISIKNPFYYIIENMDNNYTSLKESEIEFKTYEKALEEALYEAIKMI